MGALLPARAGVRRVRRVRRLGGCGAGRGRRRRAGRDRAGVGRRGRRARRAHRPAPAGRPRRDRARSTSWSTRPPTPTSWSPSTATRCRCRPAGPGCGPSTPPARSPSPAARPGARSTPPSRPPPATLRLTSPHGARWSVTDATGGAWFADGVPGQVGRRRPARSSTPIPAPWSCACPAGPLHVVAARGLEFERLELDVAPAAGETVTVDYDPARRFDPAADGWYGADLHVHLNYSGDHVLEPADAVRMQRGEGLALMHLAAGNLGGALVYDQELLEATAGTDLRADGALAAHGAGVPQPAARARARAGPDRRPGAAVHRRRGHRPPVGLAAEQRGLRPDARPRRRHHLRAPRPGAGWTTPTTCSARSATSRPGSWWPTPRSASSTPSSSSPASTTAARSCSTTTCSRAGCGWRRSRAPTRSCRSPAGPLRRRTRRAGGGCTRSSATRRWAPTRSPPRSGPGAPSSPTAPG